METSYHENYVKQLKRLLTVINKSKRKYAEASNDIESAEIKDIFNQFISERQTISSELKNQIQKLGGTTKESEDDSAELNTRHFNSTKTHTGSGHDQTVLEKIRNSEQETLDTYDDILQGSILEEFDLKTLIASQRLIVSEAFTELDRRYFSMFKSKQPY